MSHFYGTIQGTRGEATRCGDKSSGLTTHAAGWKGAIRVHVYHRNDQDHAVISLIPWQGSGGQSVELADIELDANSGGDIVPVHMSPLNTLAHVSALLAKATDMIEEFQPDMTGCSLKEQDRVQNFLDEASKAVR